MPIGQHKFSVTTVARSYLVKEFFEIFQEGVSLPFESGRTRRSARLLSIV